MHPPIRASHVLINCAAGNLVAEGPKPALALAKGFLCPITVGDVAIRIHKSCPLDGKRARPHMSSATTDGVASIQEYNESSHVKVTPSVPVSGGTIPPCAGSPISHTAKILSIAGPGRKRKLDVFCLLTRRTAVQKC